MLSDWPVDRHPPDGMEFVNEPQTQDELEALRRCVNRGCPFGENSLQKTMVEQLGLEYTLRSRVRPRKVCAEQEQ